LPVGCGSIYRRSWLHAEQLDQVATIDCDGDVGAVAALLARSD